MIDYGRFQEEIKVKANYSARTFTIRKTQINERGVFKSKYRTYRMSREEFISAQYWTEIDWRQFMKTNDYYIVS